IKAEFDVILGMSWYRQWKPIPDWETLDMLVSTPEGVKKIQHKLTAEMEVPKRPRLTVMREYRKDLQFNLITEKEAKRDLEHKGAKAMLYFVTGDREASSGLALIAASSSLTSESSSALARSFNTRYASLRAPAGSPAVTQLLTGYNDVH